MRLKTAAALILVAWLIVSLPSAAQPPPKRGPAAPPAAALDGITFAVEPGVLYLPAREVATALGWPLRWHGRTGTLYLNNAPVPPARARWLPNDTLLVPLRALTAQGVRLGWDHTRGMTSITHAERVFWVREGAKRVAINRAVQRLRAWQGERLVLDTRVSTGMPGHRTPTGSFRAGPIKDRMHYSRLYGNAPMPWSVQVIGDVFIHGFRSVPRRPASHGCVRLPLTGKNPARWFWEWIDVGTPIVIADHWPPSPPRPAP
ncbi:MAG: L,D-transpeptidase family protein [Armatimonadetes bacterium]|nr:L,D-transpeptidase family protein [Armatimonadota bacterium]